MEAEEKKSEPAFPKIKLFYKKFGFVRLVLPFLGLRC